MNMIDTSVKTYSRAVGVLLILSIVGGWFGEMYVPSIIMTGDAAGTANQLRQNEGLFRLGFAAYLVEALAPAQTQLEVRRLQALLFAQRRAQLGALARPRWRCRRRSIRSTRCGAGRSASRSRVRP